MQPDVNENNTTLFIFTSAQWEKMQKSQAEDEEGTVMATPSGDLSRSSALFLTFSVLFSLSLFLPLLPFFLSFLSLSPTQT